MNLIRLNFQHDIAYGDFTDLARRTASGDRSVNMHANHERSLDLSEELHKPIIRKFKKKQFIQDSKTIFEVLI